MYVHNERWHCADGESPSVVIAIVHLAELSICTAINVSKPPGADLTDSESVHQDTSNAQPCKPYLPPSPSPSLDVLASVNQGNIATGVSEIHVDSPLPDISQRLSSPLRFQLHHDNEESMSTLSVETAAASATRNDSGDQGPIIPFSNVNSNSSQFTIPPTFEPLCQAVDAIIEFENQSDTVVLPDVLRITCTESIPSDIDGMGNWDLVYLTIFKDSMPT
ncbi:hypothetical protein PVAG01_05636 [Phlyctema vagabunda]|uniref:Uncharacterized protein n=1 Tax=Phlyctema vagabunda TaxID=108571 RepID=A0ABR4PKL2_9HELO